MQEPAFQRLIFITMLAWQNPYSGENEYRENFPDKAFFQVCFFRSFIVIILLVAVGDDYKKIQQFVNETIKRSS